jgi:hypothetical protein
MCWHLATLALVVGSFNMCRIVRKSECVSTRGLLDVGSFAVCRIVRKSECVSTS